MYDNNALTCPCGCHGGGQWAHCTIDGGCGHLHDRTPCVLCPTSDQRLPDAGVTCHRCRERLARHLSDIEHTTVSLLPIQGAGGRGAPGHGSHPPVRLDPIALLDRRTLPHDDDEDPEMNTWARSLPGTLRGIAAWMREQRGEPALRFPSTVAGDVAYIRACIRWVGYFADDAAALDADLRELRNYVHFCAGVRRPVKIGVCTSLLDDGPCHQPLFAPVSTVRTPAPLERDDDAIVCRNRACRRVWTRDQWLTLGALQTAG